MMNSPPIQRALVSVSSKLGLADFARGLAAAGVQLYSSGGTARYLRDADIEVVDVAAYTGFPELLGGRVKTLHPAVHAGILARADRDDDRKALAEHGIVPFQLVVVNLYPFEATVARPDVTFDEAIEQIDIGGPSMVRAAAKNHAFVTVATHPEQYASILEQFTSNGATTPELRRQLARTAFAMTARYDQAITDFLAHTASDDWITPTLDLNVHLKSVLRYGENPHQKAALYALPGDRGATVITARKLHGKELSYNNLLDLDSALNIATQLPSPGAVVIKHNNPCGAATGDSLASAARRAWDGDPLSAFGSVVGFNQPVDEATAEWLVEPNRFVEAIIAPGFSQQAVEILTTRPKWKASVRLLDVGPLGTSAQRLELRHVSGGLLVQEADNRADPMDQWTVLTTAQPTPEQTLDLQFAWSVCRNVKSNAIVLARDQMLVGVGAGQMSRVDAVELAIRKAGERSQGAVLASDGFFPFDDSIVSAAQAGVVAVIQPAGSRRDDEVIAACDRHQLPMIGTGRRHFKH